MSTRLHSLMEHGRFFRLFHSYTMWNAVEFLEAKCQCSISTIQSGRPMVKPQQCCQIPSLPVCLVTVLYARYGNLWLTYTSLLTSLYDKLWEIMAQQCYLEELMSRSRMQALFEIVKTQTVRLACHALSFPGMNWVQEFGRRTTGRSQKTCWEST